MLVYFEQNTICMIQRENVHHHHYRQEENSTYLQQHSIPMIDNKQNNNKCLSELFIYFLL